MQRLGSTILYSATDLTRFAECQHLSWLDRLDLDQPMPKAEDDDQAQLIQAKGLAHERGYLAALRMEGRSITEIDSAGAIAERVARTSAALHAGVEVIYQAALVRDNLVGHADFLVRVGGPNPHGRYQYEVVDTKLARSAKAKFIIQLCFYSELLSDRTGRLPTHMHVELGDGRRETFRTTDYIHYFRQLLDRFLEYVGAWADRQPPYPVPCDFCQLCHWRDRCDAKRVADDHLSGVAKITRQQVGKLEAAGVNTIARLATLTADANVPTLPEQTRNRLREQAALQVLERETGQQKAVPIDAPAGEIRGFARLPEPDPGDLFFDMEGDPMEPGGLEYLFGVYGFEDGHPWFRCFWAHDRIAERRAFNDFMDLVAERRARFPSMHIYHYANYENAALKRLMSLHGVREADVDQLLREHRLVDLYKVVREGLRISRSSYSIKTLEAFYSGRREGEVKKATDSIVVYERWRESRDPELLESIRRYNEDDCRSTWQLRDWLLSQRPASLPWFSAEAAEESHSGPKRSKSDKTVELEATLAEFHRRLIAAPENPTLAPEIAELTYYLLDFHRRAEKPVWWALFDRQSADLEDLLDDPEVIAGLNSPEWVRVGDRFDTFKYRYPEQDFKARAGDHAKRLDTLQDVLIRELDEDAQTIAIELRTGDDGVPPRELSISTGAPINVDSIRRALFAFADGLIRGEGAHKALTDYLQRQIPTVRGVESGKPILAVGSGDPISRIVSVAQRLDDSYLFIQGPPGTGKTYTGSHLIAALLSAGKRVAVSSNSHKAINNLLQAVDKRAKETGLQYSGMKKSSSAEQNVESDFIANVSDDGPITKHRPQLVAGTAWLFSKKSMWGEFDYLFIDEAGQVSLANTIAMGMCARNLILLGDQMQLGQPIQGVHPGRSGESALDYLLNGEPTIAPERGVFLEKSYRMHPDVCRFISDAIYDSRLHSDQSTFAQALVLDGNAHPALRPTGIRYVSVDHDGCSQSCHEEAELAAELVENLLTQRYRSGDGTVRPVTLDDILVVAPYNLQVNLLKRTLPSNARVGTVDKFQGQEGQIVIVSMTTSGPEYMPRHMDFLYSRNRLNVALSRARCLALLLANDRLRQVACSSPDDAALVNTLCWVAEQTQ